MDIEGKSYVQNIMKKAFFFPQTLSKASNEWPIQVPQHHLKLLDYYCCSNILYRNSCALGHKSVIKPTNTAGFNSFHRASFHWNTKSCQNQHRTRSINRNSLLKENWKGIQRFWYKSQSYMQNIFFVCTHLSVTFVHSNSLFIIN